MSYFTSYLEKVTHTACNALLPTLAASGVSVPLWYRYLKYTKNSNATFKQYVKYKKKQVS